MENEIVILPLVPQATYAVLPPATAQPRGLLGLGLEIYCEGALVLVHVGAVPLRMNLACYRIGQSRVEGQHSPIQS